MAPSHLDAQLLHVPFQDMARTSQFYHVSVTLDISRLMQGISALSSPSRDPVARTLPAESAAGAQSCGLPAALALAAPVPVSPARGTLIGSTSKGVSAAAAGDAVAQLVKQIHSLKRKLGEGRRAEVVGITKCRARIAALLAQERAAAPSGGDSSKAAAVAGGSAVPAGCLNTFHPATATGAPSPATAAEGLSHGGTVSGASANLDADVILGASAILGVKSDPDPAVRAILGPRCDRLIADYLLRTGRPRSAGALCASYDQRLAGRAGGETGGGPAAAAQVSLTGNGRESHHGVGSQNGIGSHNGTGSQNGTVCHNGMVSPNGSVSHNGIVSQNGLGSQDGSVLANGHGVPPRIGACEGETGLASLVDSSPFRECERLVAALMRRDAAPALEWCEAEGERLSKIKSSLASQLHLQHFLGLVAASDGVSAVAYARAHLQPSALPPDVAVEARRGMALLALGPSTSSPASALLHPSRWDAAATALSAAFLRLAGAPPSPSLAVALAAGIVALRTPACCADAGQRVHRCPTCQEPMRALAAALPTCQRGRTVLACRISRQPIDEDNPPLVAPSGHVYSRQGVRMLTVEAACGDAFRDPHTNTFVPVDAMRRAYFL